MLILVTMGLLAVAAVALAVGFVSNHLGPIYVSMICSALAGVVLMLVARLTRRQTAVTVAAGRAPLGNDSTSAFQGRPSAPRFREPRSHARTAIFQAVPVEDEYDDVDDNSYGGWVEEPLFPIEDYDELRVSDIVPLLAELDLDELDEVREREAAGKKRATVLTRIRQLSVELEAVSGPPAARTPAPARAKPAATKTASTGSRRRVAPPFPIDNYDDLRANEIVAVLAELDDAELELVAGRELAGGRRTTILSRLGKLLGRPLLPETAAAPPRHIVSAPAAQTEGLGKGAEPNGVRAGRRPGTPREGTRSR